MVSADEPASRGGHGHRGLVVLLEVADRVAVQVAQGRGAAGGALETVQRGGDRQALGSGGHGLRVGVALGASPVGRGGDPADIAGAVERAADEVGPRIYSPSSVGRAVGTAGHVAGNGTA